jgi:PhnB protein
MNQSLIPYLTFNGCCKDAMLFYEKCLGGNLELQTIADSPLANQFPVSMKSCILHATLTTSYGKLFGSDLNNNELIIGNAISISLNCQSENELNMIFTNLSESGTIKYPVETTYYGGLLGSLTDKYGYNWFLHFKNN